MTRPSARPTSLTLSREMKLLLVLLLLAALIGAWYVWTSGRTAGTGDQSPAPTPSAGAPEASSTAPSGLAVQPGSQVDVPTLPPYGTPDTSAAAPPASDTPPTPGGINPDTPLAALPSVNPFRPLALDAKANSAAPVPRSTPAPATRLAQPVTPPAPPVVTPAPVGGALAIAPLPGSGGAVKVEAPTVTGGAFPTPTLPGASRNGPEPAVVTLKPPATTSVTPQPQPQAPSSGTPVLAPKARSAVTPVVTSAPVRPPLAGMSVPRSSIDLTGTLASTPSEKGSSTETSVTALPAPGTPQPITQLGADSAETTPVNALEQLIHNRQLSLNATVLGPVNTAILRSRDGFLVVSVGQALPDTKVVVRDVTASSITLALDNDTKTLELDKR